MDSSSKCTFYVQSAHLTCLRTCRVSIHPFHPTNPCPINTKLTHQFFMITEAVLHRDPHTSLSHHESRSVFEELKFICHSHIIFFLSISIQSQGRICNSRCVIIILYSSSLQERDQIWMENEALWYFVDKPILHQKSL